MLRGHRRAVHRTAESTAVDPQIGLRAIGENMADVQARVVTGSDGEVALYLWSDEKTPGGASMRFARLSVEDGEILLWIETREPEEHHTIEEVSVTTLGAAMLRAFAHVQQKDGPL